MEVSDQLHAPAALAQGRSPCTHSIGGWVGPTAGLDIVSKNSQPPPGIETRSSDRPARSQSLYRLQEQTFPGALKSDKERTNVKPQRKARPQRKKGKLDNYDRCLLYRIVLRVLWNEKKGLSLRKILADGKDKIHFEGKK
jgi:hypothetical protein